MWDQQVTLTIDFSQVLTPKCHLLLLTVFGDRKVFPQAMKGFKSRGEEGEAGTHTHTQSTKVPLVRFPIACDVRGNLPSSSPPFKDIQRRNLLLAYWKCQDYNVDLFSLFTNTTQTDRTHQISIFCCSQKEESRGLFFENLILYGESQGSILYANEPFRRWIYSPTYDISWQFPNVLSTKNVYRGTFYGSVMSYFVHFFGLTFFYLLSKNQ